MQSRSKRMSKGTRRTILLGGVSAVFGAGAVAYGLGQTSDTKAKIDLSQYRMTFNEEFDGPPGEINQVLKRWYPHTPWHGDFGDAQFVDPTPGFPFIITDGCLRIEARKSEDGRWRSGLLASVRPDGSGFSQQYGYFELRAKFPPGPGTWPAFWLDSLVPQGLTDPSIEIDVIEYYGQFTKNYRSAVHVWPKDGSEKTAEGNLSNVPDGSLVDSFHVYGVSVEKDWIIMFLDGEEFWRTKTPLNHKHRLMVLFNLALGSGWPIDNTPSPSYMYVDYIRVYEKL